MRERSIQEAAREVGVTESKIRFWERTIKGLRFPRSATGHRVFYDEDIEVLRYIKFLREDKHIPLEQISDLLNTHRHIYRKEYQLIDRLGAVRRFLEEVIESLTK